MVLFIIIFFRILNSLTICTTYNPDEYWQSLEVAFKIVNKFGYLTWEWEPCISLRSVIHPLIFTTCYFVINFLKFISGMMCRNSYQYFCSKSYYFYIPRLFQSFFAVLTDIGTSKVGYLIFHKKYYARMKTKTEDNNNNNNLKMNHHKINISDLENSVLLYISYYQKICSKYELDFITLFLSLFSWYNFFTLCRTYSQTIENCMNIWSIYFIIKSDQSIIGGNYSDKKSLFIGVLISSLSVLVRHSSIQFWIVLYFILFFLQVKNLVNKSKVYSSSTIKVFIGICLIVAIITIPIMFYLDYWFYQEFTISMINFVKFNLIRDLGQIYGSNSKLYYFTEAPIVTLLSFFPLLIPGIIESINSENQIFKISQISTLITLAILSNASHKEFRFIIPYFPIILITLTLGIYKSISGIHNSLKTNHKKSLHFLNINISQLIFNKKFIIATLLIQIIPALFFTTIFQRGGESVIRYLSNSDLKENDSIFFVSQCHMYPAYSYLNKNVKIGFFDCSAPINQVSNLKNLNEILWKHPNTTQFLDEIFVINHSKNSSYTSPYVSPNVPIIRNTSNFDNCLNYRFDVKLSGDLPTFFVIHSYFNDNLQDWLHKHDYKLIKSVFDSFFTETPIGLVPWSYYYIYKKG